MEGRRRSEWMAFDRRREPLLPTHPFRRRLARGALWA